MKCNILGACVLLTALAATSTASATLITNVAQAQDFASTSNGVYFIGGDANDLGQAPGTVISGSGTLNNYSDATLGDGHPGAGPEYLFDGGAAYGGKYMPSTATAASFNPATTYSSWSYGYTDLDVCPTSGASVTVTFASTSLGYNISSIVSLSGSQGNRDVQDYTISVLPHGSSTWSSLGAVQGGTDYAGNKEVLLTVTGPSGGPVATGVDAVKFTFGAGTGATFGSYSLYREIDIHGSSVVPEPGTLMLLATGLIGLLAYAGRRRK